MVVAALVYMFPECSRVTPEGLQHIGNLTKLRILVLHGLSVNVTSGQGQKDPWGWIRGPLKTLKILEISGELQRHIHTVDISTAWTVLTGQQDPSSVCEAKSFRTG